MWSWLPRSSLCRPSCSSTHRDPPHSRVLGLNVCVCVCIFKNTFYHWVTPTGLLLSQIRPILWVLFLPAFLCVKQCQARWCKNPCHHLIPKRLRIDMISPISQMKTYTSQAWSRVWESCLLTRVRCICWVNVQCCIHYLFYSDNAHLSFVRDEWFPPLLMITWPMCSVLLLEKQGLK